MVIKYENSLPFSCIKTQFCPIYSLIDNILSQSVSLGKCCLLCIILYVRFYLLLPLFSYFFLLNAKKSINSLRSDMKKAHGKDS
jgi:hypothetical protein